MFWFSLVATLLHVYEEQLGSSYAPLGDEFCDIALWKRPINWALGFLLFGVGLAVALGALSWFAYRTESLFLLGVLVGARLGDCAFSHWSPNYVYRRMVPGGYTTTLYVLECLYILVTWTDVSGLGVIVGATAFFVVLPALRLMGELDLAMEE